MNELSLVWKIYSFMFARIKFGNFFWIAFSTHMTVYMPFFHRYVVLLHTFITYRTIILCRHSNSYFSIHYKNHILLYTSFFYKLPVECLVIVNLLQEVSWLDICLSWGLFDYMPEIVFLIWVISSCSCLIFESITTSISLL